MLRKLKIFSKKKEESYKIENLNEICNGNFERLFNKCKSQLGQELVELMNLKKSLMEGLNIESSQNTIKESLAQKILSLIILYFKLAESYVNILNNSKNIVLEEAGIEKVLVADREKLRRVYYLIASLHVQFCLNQCNIAYADEFDDIFSEAAALNKVLKENLSLRNGRI
ncbi:MAG: hypothetical protein N2645_14800 [Clostridia bacterium]|nr:hypothetical protein [Clostridia bacterium]